MASSHDAHDATSHSHSQGEISSTNTKKACHHGAGIPVSVHPYHSSPFAGLKQVLLSRSCPIPITTEQWHASCVEWLTAPDTPACHIDVKPPLVHSVDYAVTDGVQWTRLYVPAGSRICVPAGARYRFVFEDDQPVACYFIKSEHVCDAVAPAAAHDAREVARTLPTAEEARVLVCELCRHFYSQVSFCWRGQIQMGVGWKGFGCKGSVSS